MTYPPIVYPIEIAWPSLTPFLAANFLASLVVSLAIPYLLLGNPNRLLRPALVFAAACNLIFQWPLLLVSDAILASLAQPWLFAASAHLPVLAAVGHVRLTRSLDRPADVGGPRPFASSALLPVGLLMVALLAIFMARVPFDCTALYANIIDPAAALLAREVTIKFAGSAIATSAYGAVANSVGPAVVGLLFVLLLRLMRRGRWLLAILALAAILPCMAFILLGGAKGLLVPTFIVVVFAALSVGQSLVRRILSLAAAIVVLITAMVTLELARDREGQIVDYDFNSCVARLGHEREGAALLQSMAGGGLGLSARRIQLYLGDEAVTTNAVPRQTISPQRAGSYVSSLVRRAVVTPLQVASWHLLYVEQHGSPGPRVLPLSKYLFGSSIDITSLVYQAYGVEFSDGDRTITSTAPTSFIFAYPAYFGLPGLLAGIFLILAFDALMSLAQRGLACGNAYIAGGLGAVVCYNLLTSDFYTVMVSHGGGIALLIVVIMHLGGKKIT